MDIGSLAIFAGVYFLAVASPGPAIAALVARSLATGFRRSLPFAAGIVAGDLIWFSLTAFGLAVLMQSFHGLFVAIKYAGCAYLLYLACKLWTAPADAPPAPAAARGEGLRLFLGGIALTLGNPKVMVFFLSILPLVVDLERDDAARLRRDRDADHADHRRDHARLCLCRRSGAPAGGKPARAAQDQPADRRRHGRRSRRHRGARLNARCCWRRGCSISASRCSTRPSGGSSAGPGALRRPGS